MPEEELRSRSAYRAQQLELLESRQWTALPVSTRCAVEAGRLSRCGAFLGRHRWTRRGLCPDRPKLRIRRHSTRRYHANHRNRPLETLPSELLDGTGPCARRSRALARCAGCQRRALRERFTVCWRKHHSTDQFGVRPVASRTLDAAAALLGPRKVATPSALPADPRNRRRRHGGRGWPNAMTAALSRA